MSRVPETATAMRLRKSEPASAVKTYPYRIYLVDGLRYDLLAPSEASARQYVERRSNGIAIERACLAADDMPVAAKRRAR